MDNDRIAMRRTIILLMATLLAGCGTMRRITGASSSASTTGQTLADRTAESAGHTVEKSSEATTSESETERTTVTVETTTTTVFSPPDSLGNQHKVRETTSTKKTDETERTGSSTKQQTEGRRESDSQTASAERIDTKNNTNQTATVTEEKERKGNLWSRIGAIALGLLIGGLIVATVKNHIPIIRWLRKFMP
jgi:uncharacterized protein YceK